MNRLEQTHWVAALFHPEKAPLTMFATEDAERFVVYQNNIIVSLIDSLVDSFPALVQLLGENYFHAVAREFVQENPPNSPVMAEYGTQLPGYLEGFLPLEMLPYLADVARLELARIACFHAADSATLSAEDFTSLSIEALLSASFVLNPSLRLVVSEHPIFKLWHSQIHDSPIPALADWRGEEVICLRRKNVVITKQLQLGGALFLKTLINGQTLEEAWKAASAKDPGFNLTEALGSLVNEQLTVSIIY
ncbi:MAG: putative DNA-binding domain-containing protein [Methylomicrobium sp.]|nr:putative DNA-binding domain-containing protein [Methylomicrobium sp.]